MTKIKICGLRTKEDVDAVNQAGPDYAGFVFAPSKRQVSDEQAAVLRSLLSKEIRSVGVFVNDSIAHIASLCREHVIDLIQLHGEESEEYIRQVREQTHVPIIRAVRLASKEEGIKVLATTADYLLYDAFAGKDVYGGSGTELNTSLLPSLVRPTFLAGGLNPENVGQIITSYHPFCVDVSSGVETEGRKDYCKLEQFIQNVRKAGGSRR